MSRLRGFLGDQVLFGLVMLLSLFGVAMVFSAGQLDVENPLVASLWQRQLLFLVVSVGVMVLVMRVPLRWFEWAAVPLYTAGALVLVLTLVIGTGKGTAAGVKSWIDVGPIGIQPSQFVNLAMILMLARVMSGWHESPRSVFDLWRPLLVMALPIGLVMLQPDLGTAMVFGAVGLVALYWGGTPLGVLFLLLSPFLGLLVAFEAWMFSVYMLVLVGFLWLYRAFLWESVVVVAANLAAGTIALPLWNALEPYQRNRLLVFLDPGLDPQGAGWHVTQSRVAIGSGGLFGKGWLLGTQKRLAFLPEQHTDFIFSVIGEEFGFLGTALTLFVFGLVLWRLIRIAEKVPDPFAGIVVFGIFGAWFAHIIVNVGMTIGLMPVTGIPLPFVSYGGSFLLASFVALGIVQRVAKEHTRVLK